MKNKVLRHAVAALGALLAAVPAVSLARWQGQLDEIVDESERIYARQKR